MAVLVTLWGCRLTYNFVIKGGFSGAEDYRWAVIRKWFPGFQFEVFNFVFICYTQMLLILGFTAPAFAAQQSTRGWQATDSVAAALFALLLLGETVADRQMFAYQTEKYRRIQAGEPAGDYERGFIETGLWAYSRHPNYFCEVGMWWCFYLFAVGATGAWLNWSVCGAIFLTILFVPPGASLDVTESLSSQKYPKYAEYQKRVSRFVPWFPADSKSVDEVELE
jgi:steroid 5-alpha reductase family enzyme